jgi:hypothetical protein
MNPDPVIIGILLSDYVIMEAGSGKYSLIGTFNSMQTQGFPFITPHFFVTVLLTNLPPHFEQMNVTVRIEEPKSAHVLTSAAGNIKPPQGFNFPTHYVMQLPFLMPQFVIQQQDAYTVVVLVDGESVGRRTLVVAALQAPALPQTPPQAK